jgi:hypothetical protein
MNIRPNRAEVIALGALVVAMSGTGYAAVGQLRKGSVTEAALHAKAVTARKIAPGAVTTPAIHTAAVVSSKIARGAIHFDQLATNSVGTAAIADGNVTSSDLGSDVTSAIASARRLATRTSSTSATFGANRPGDLTAGCAAGEVLVGGGFEVPSGVAVVTSAPSRTPGRWFVAVETGTRTATVSAFARCLSH